MRSVSTRSPLGSRVERISRVWGVLGVAFSATGTEMAILDIVSRPAVGRYWVCQNGGRMLRKLTFLIALSAVFGTPLVLGAQQRGSQAKSVYELRIYKLNPANKQDFHD